MPPPAGVMVALEGPPAFLKGPTVREGASNPDSGVTR
jgi:hypothetical protein